MRATNWLWWVATLGTFWLGCESSDGPGADTVEHLDGDGTSEVDLENPDTTLDAETMDTAPDTLDTVSPGDTLEPVDTTDIDTSPADTSPADTMPADTSPTDTMPADTSPADTMPADTSPADTSPADTTPADTSPADTGPADTGPADTTPADTGPTDTSPADTSPADTSPADTTPSDSTDTSGGCQVVTMAAPILAYEAGQYAAGGDLATDLGFGGSGPDVFYVELYSAATGTFGLGTGANANYRTCDQCVRVAVDGVVGVGATRTFFQRAGTLSVAGDPLGTATISLSGVTLEEVTLASDFTSTPVPGGACVTLSDRTFTASVGGPPDGWSCDPGWFDDGDCDCGCGALDVDCEDTTLASCDFCVACDGANCPDGIDPEDITQCGGEEPCGPPDLVCDGACARCPPAEGTTGLACSPTGGRCVASGCTDGYVPCGDGCCGFSDPIVIDSFAASVGIGSGAFWAPAIATQTQDDTTLVLYTRQDLTPGDSGYTVVARLSIPGQVFDVDYDEWRLTGNSSLVPRPDLVAAADGGFHACYPTYSPTSTLRYAHLGLFEFTSGRRGFLPSTVETVQLATSATQSCAIAVDGAGRVNVLGATAGGSLRLYTRSLTGTWTTTNIHEAGAAMLMRLEAGPDGLLGGLYRRDPTQGVAGGLVRIQQQANGAVVHTTVDDQLLARPYAMGFGFAYDGSAILSYHDPDWDKFYFRGTNGTIATSSWNAPCASDECASALTTSADGARAYLAYELSPDRSVPAVIRSMALPFGSNKTVSLPVGRMPAITTGPGGRLRVVAVRSAAGQTPQLLLYAP